MPVFTCLSLEDKENLCLSVQLLGSGSSRRTVQVIFTSPDWTSESGLETISCLHIKFILQSNCRGADKPLKISLQQQWGYQGHYIEKQWQVRWDIVYNKRGILQKVEKTKSTFTLLHKSWFRGKKKVHGTKIWEDHTWLLTLARFTQFTIA